jgi:hypothetical protein
MNKMIMILAILTFSIPSFGFPIIGCGDYFSKLESDLNDLFGSKCHKDDGEAKYCGCISEARNSNVLIKSIDPELTLKEYQQQNLKKNQEKLLDIYNNLNFEVSFQEHKFYMNTDEKELVGCTPEDMASEYNKALEQENQREFQREFQRELKTIDGGDKITDKVLNSGRLNIDALSTDERTIIAKNINKEAGFKVYEAPVVEAKNPTIALTTYQFTDAQIAGGGGPDSSNLKKTVRLCSNSPENAKGMSEEIKKTLTEAKTFFTKYPELFVTTDLAELNILLDSPGCELPMALIEQINNEYRAKIQYSKKYFENADHRSVAERVAAINFSEKNAELEGKFKKDMTDTPENGCLDYNEYKTFNSAPSDLLMTDLAGKTEKEIETLLDPKNLKTSSNLTDFLKKNPILAKNTINPAQRTAVANAMSKLFGKIQGIKDPNDRFADYSNFMKNDIAAINKKDKMMDFLQCDLLARNYAALASTEDLPALGIIDVQDNVSNVANQYMACKILAENEKNPNKQGLKPSLEELVAANDLFSLFDSKPMSPKDDVGYMEFLDKSCPGYEAFVKEDLKCMPWMKKNTCKEKAQNAEAGKHERTRDRYFSRNPDAANAKKIRDLIAKNTQKLDTDEIAKKTKKKYQSKIARKNYVEKVQPIFAGRSIFNTDNIFRPSASGSASGAPSSPGDKIAGSSSGSSGSVFDTINQAQESYAPTSPISNGVGRSIASTYAGGENSTQTFNSPVNNQISNNGVNSGQQVPAYSNEPLRSAVVNKEVNKEIENLIPDFADKSDKEKIESLEDLAESNPEIAEKLDLTKKIESIKEKIANLEPENNAKFVSKGGTKPRDMNFSTNTNSVNSGSINRVTNSGSSSNSGSTFGKGNSITKSTGQNAVNLANLEKYKNTEVMDGDKSPLRSTANVGSLVVSSNTVVDFTMGTTDPSALVVTGAELPLTPETAADYDKIYTDVDALKKFLVKNLQGKSIESRVVRIKDPVANPEKFVLFLVSSGNSGHLNVKTINRTTTFKGLVNTINVETKSN